MGDRMLNVDGCVVWLSVWVVILMVFLWLRLCGGWCIRWVVVL